MTKPIERDPIYRGRRFQSEIIELCVRWYITYRLSYRDLVAMMAERGIIVSHTTIMRWIMRIGCPAARAFAIAATKSVTCCGGRRNRGARGWRIFRHRWVVAGPQPAMVDSCSYVDLLSKLDTMSKRSHE